jgi:hypothetical protein
VALQTLAGFLPFLHQPTAAPSVAGAMAKTPNHVPRDLRFAMGIDFGAM